MSDEMWQETDNPQNVRELSAFARDGFICERCHKGKTCRAPSHFALYRLPLQVRSRSERAYSHRDYVAFVCLNHVPARLRAKARMLMLVAEVNDEQRT